VLSRLLLLGLTLSAPRWTRAIPDPGNFLSPTLSGARPAAAPALARWYQWDAAWYLRIAGNGPQMGYSTYTENKKHAFGPFAFFPLYPLSVRAVAAVIPGAEATVPVGGAPAAGLIVASLIASNLAFVLALVALYLFAGARAGPAVARRAVLLLCVFPTTIFFSASYSESLFLLWLVGFFLALDRRWFVVAALCGALASATRSLGVALAAPYLLAYWQDWRAARRSEAPSVKPFWRDVDLRALAPVVLIPLGLIAYMVYQWASFGDPLLFQKAEKAWSRSFALPWVGLVDGISWSLRGWGHMTQPQWRGLVDALYAVLFLALCVPAWRSMDRPARAYAVVFWLYVLCTPQISNPKYPDTLISMPRFLLMLLPLWLWLARSRARTLLMLAPSAVLLVLYGARWVNGGWIG